MELREYGAILVRRWQLILVVTVLTLAASALMLAFGPQSYKSEIRLTVSVKPEPKLGNYFTYDNYYTWLSTEYLVDDLGEVIKSDAFTGAVSQRLGGMFVSKDSLNRNLSTKKTHRILTVTVTTNNPHHSFLIAQAIKDTLNETAAEYFAQLDTTGGVIRVLDEPSAQAEMSRSRILLEILLRGSVGLLAAVGFAFLLNYLDPSVRGAREAEQLLGLPVLAEIPR